MHKQGKDLLKQQMDRLFSRLMFLPQVLLCLKLMLLSLYISILSCLSVFTLSFVLSLGQSFKGTVSSFAF